MLKHGIKEFHDGKGTFYAKVQLSDNISIEEDTGFLYCKNSILGNVGEQEYYGKEIGLKDEQADKIIVMIRDEADVFDENSLSSFEGKPVTLFHPKGKVDSKNYKEYIVGVLKDAKRDGDNLVGDLIVYDNYTIQLITDGEVKDLSLGYKAKVVPVADNLYRQEDIVVNHLAIVEEGRAANARIVDEKTVKDGVEEETKPLEPQDFTDKVHVTESKSTTVRVNEYDDVTGEETTKEISTYESKHSHYDKAKQALIDSVKNKKQGENQMEKDFKYFMAELKDLATYPKGEFRDSAYKALADDCKETLGVTLPTIEDTKKSVIADSVGFKPEEKQERQEQKQKKALTVFAKDEERFFTDMYRKMDDPEYARKLAGMTGYDVERLIRQGGSL